MSENGVTCMTGVVAFLTLSLLVNAIGIPLLLILFKRETRLIENNYIELLQELQT